MSRVLGFLSVIVVTLTISTAPVLAEYPEGCNWVEDGATSLYSKGANSDPKTLFATFCNALTCSILADMLNKHSLLSKESVYWCE